MTTCGTLLAESCRQLTLAAQYKRFVQNHAGRATFDAEPERRLLGLQNLCGCWVKDKSSVPADKVELSFYRPRKAHWIPRS